ncbi:hypothetical protein [Desulfovibrio ferrophilus]|uniref:Uncharacterized protein n=1 Tax=Desulfovibrio ferrophilus TaxID=241368 RepID=A0A2Z6B0J1_9BACT|nr:hypothetical protein [Desulfovibrio ferrophilus]BBD09047.1 uncharacterized protein DFE_2321 [Desulfovibrio ferrophilus]
MSILNATQASQAFDAYSRIASQRTVEERAQKAVQEARTATETARVRKTTIGFSLGKFGIDFTAQDVELDTERIARDARSGQQQMQRARSETFSSHLEAAEILSTAEPRSAKQANPDEPDTSNLTRRRALEAYAEASLNFETIVPGRLGSI